MAPPCGRDINDPIHTVHANLSLQPIPASLLNTDSTLKMKALNVAAKYPLQ